MAPLAKPAEICKDYNSLTIDTVFEKIKKQRSPDDPENHTILKNLENLEGIYAQCKELMEDYHT